MTTFVDTNILIYLLDQNSPFHTWCVDQLQKCKLNGPTIISDIVYSEFSAGMKSKAEVDEAVDRLGMERIRGSDMALFRAGAAFKTYKARGGPKNRMLPDFLVGAIADDVGAPLMTADRSEFARMFPTLSLITP